MNESLTTPDLKVLRKEFPDNRLCFKRQATNRDKTKAMLVAYVQHTDVMERLDEVDPAWSCQAIEQKEIGEITYVRMRMTVKGVSRENVGEGDHPKAAFSDAVKRCAMLFGIGRYLYGGEQKWVPYNEDRDKYREWTLEDYRGRKEAEADEEESKSRRRGSRSPEGHGEYVVRFGRKYQGFKLKEIKEADLISYVRFVEDDPEPLSTAAQEFVEKAKAYLRN